MVTGEGAYYKSSRFQELGGFISWESEEARRALLTRASDYGTTPENALIDPLDSCSKGHNHCRHQSLDRRLHGYSGLPRCFNECRIFAGAEDLTRVAVALQSNPGLHSQRA